MRAALIALCLFVMTPVADAASPPNPKQVEASIAAKGAKPTINDLVQKDQWDAVTNAISTGKSSWVALAPQLAPGADAGSAEDLGISLALALPKNGLAVLAAIDPKDGIVMGAGRVCGRPFIENTEPPHYVYRALIALKGVKDSKLAQVKSACLDALRRSTHGKPS